MNLCHGLRQWFVKDLVPVVLPYLVNAFAYLYSRRYRREMLILICVYTSRLHYVAFSLFRNFQTAR